MNDIYVYGYGNPNEVIKWLNDTMGPATIRWDLKELHLITFVNPKDYLLFLIAWPI